MENWAELRRRVLVDGLSGRAACREYKIHWKTLKKILDNSEPPGYRRTKPRRPSILEPLLPVVHQILEDDKKAPRKQRHTAKRIFDRIVAEGYEGGRYRFEGEVPLDRTGPFGYTVRVLPRHDRLATPAELGLVAQP